MAKSGSIPCEQLAIMLIVPVGAIVVTVAFLIVLNCFAHMLSEKFGKFPFSLPSSTLVFLASVFMNFMSVSPVWRPSSVLYCMPILMSISAKPITPKPIFLLPLVVFSISGKVYTLASMTLSKNLTANLTAFRSLSQFILPSSAANLLTSMLPRLQLS